MPISPSGKIPAHDPKSPTPQEVCPPQRMEGGGGSADASPGFVQVQMEGREGHGADVESTKEARMPTQKTPDAEKSTLEYVVESTKEARMPIQVSPEAEKSFSDLSEIEKAKDRPIQESQNPKNSITDTTNKAEFMTDGKEARQPTQATSEAEKSSGDVSELENMKEKPVQESENPKSSMSGTPAMEDEVMKETPVQESEEPKAKKDELKENPERSVRHVFQEGDLKDLVKDRQESKDPTSEDSKVEIEDQRDVRGEQPLQETHGPGKVQGTEAEDTRQVKEGEEAHEELSEGKPLQESTSSDVQTKTCEEETLPTQETMAAGKGPFEETGLEVGVKGQPLVSEGEPLQERVSSDVQNKSCEDSKVEIEDQRDVRGKQPLQETHGPGKVPGTEVEDTRQVKEGEEAHEELSEGKPLQESTSSDVQTKTCEEETLPTQETMAAGKGPFEETGLEVGVKGQPLVSEGEPLQERVSSDVQNKSCEDSKVEIEDQRDVRGEQPLQETHGPGKVQGTEAEDTRQVKEGEEAHEELSEGKPLQESTSSDVQTKTCEEEALPTQETMAAGKGPFEETGLEVGVKGQPTDEQEK